MIDFYLKSVHFCSFRSKLITMPFQSDIKLDEIIGLALKADDIQKGLTEANYSEQKLIKELEAQATEVWQPVQNDVDEIDRLKEKIEDFKVNYPFLFNVERKKDRRHHTKPLLIVASIEIILIAFYFAPFITNVPSSALGYFFGLKFPAIYLLSC
jgi:hypothetical protein